MDSLELIRVEGTAPDAPVSLVDPDTGEVVALADASPQLIAAVLGRIQLALEENRERLGEAKRWLGRELIERMDAGAEWTVQARGVKVSAPSPAAKRYSWDAEELHGILNGLVVDGVITLDAALRACEQRIEYVPVVAGINKLLKNPKAEQRILIARREAEPPTRSVSVKVNAGEI